MRSWVSKMGRRRWLQAGLRAGFALLSWLPVKRRLIVFESFMGRQYSCNPRAIYEYMRAHRPEYQLLWSAHPEAEARFAEHGVSYVRRFSPAWWLAMARARYWVTNSRLPQWMSKPRHTVYVQTWHGTPLKRLAGDMSEVHIPGQTNDGYKRGFYREAAKWDYLVSPNAYSTAIFRRAFRYTGEVLETGYPRNDYLYTHHGDGSVARIRQRLGIPDGRRVLLYAPTWRDDEYFDVGRYRFGLHMDLERMRERLGDSFVLLLRLHYLVAERMDLGAYKGFAIDVSNHEDIRELYLISDLLITDYSSVMFDYANLRRPMVFYVYDLETYRDRLRGFYFDFEREAPGPLVRNTEEIIAAVEAAQASGFQPTPALEAFAHRFCRLECGESARRVVEHVFGERKKACVQP
ncbi:CDP-glycerol glycerophosphotransferase family protein [Alicyclobacillus kakegawensis]|uniref:CDP-glycerol glycerophosphotransferase family protein n=1 Tax=Alicyclobacillus kakegawensis TaxID=392012 RepID=UPI000835AB7D|nr:CDP-glycerol glycerophosphotransferase family protein [Alicyclobacillus kakegawensis]